MNVIDFIRESAAFMVADRPDIYDHETAVEELSVCIDSLRELGDSLFETISFTSYLLSRINDGECEEFILARKVTSTVIFPDGEADAYSHTEGINLPHVLDTDGLDC